MQNKKGAKTIKQKQENSLAHLQNDIKAIRNEIKNLVEIETNLEIKGLQIKELQDLQSDLNNAIKRLEKELQATQRSQIGVNNSSKQDIEALINEIKAVQDYVLNNKEISLHLINEKITELKEQITTDANNETIKAHDNAIKQYSEEQAYLLNRINKLENKINTYIESQNVINSHIKSNLRVFENNDILTNIKDLKQQIDILTNHYLEIEKKYNEKLENIRQLIPIYKNKSIWELIKMKFQG